MRPEPLCNCTCGHTHNTSIATGAEITLTATDGYDISIEPGGVEALAMNGGDGWLFCSISCLETSVIGLLVCR